MVVVHCFEATPRTQHAVRLFDGLAKLDCLTLLSLAVHNVPLAVLIPLVKSAATEAFVEETVGDLTHIGGLKMLLPSMRIYQKVYSYSICHFTILQKHQTRQVSDSRSTQRSTTTNEHRKLVTCYMSGYYTCLIQVASTRQIGPSNE